MSNFLFGIAGAAIGSAFGMPALGFALGSGVGAALGGHHSHNNTPSHFAGARLNDLKIQTSIYGIGIPRLYGIYRMAGNVIWATDIVEVSDASQSGNYLYYGNFAIGLCAGPMAGIRRLWADGKEIFKADHKESQESLRTHYPKNLRFYGGDEEQLPDPLIEAHQGKGQVPGFRGLAYLVFEHFPLANFNNRLPNIAVEVVQSAVALPSEEPVTASSREEKRRTREETLTQKGIRYRVRSDRHQKPALENEKKVIPSTVPLATVVKDVCQQAGITPESVEVSLLSNTVTGFILSQPTAAREALSLLQQAYFFDVVESGSQFKCVPRGVLKPVPIAEEELAQEEGVEESHPIVVTRLPSLDLPQSVTLFFTDAQADYAILTQTAQRQGGAGRLGERVELPLVLNREEALAIAEALLAEAWGHRSQVSFSLPRSYAGLDPSDRLVLANQVLRVLSVAYGSPGLVKIKAVCE